MTEEQFESLMRDAYALFVSRTETLAELMPALFMFVNAVCNEVVAKNEDQVAIRQSCINSLNIIIEDLEQPTEEIVYDKPQ